MPSANSATNSAAGNPKLSIENPNAPTAVAAVAAVARASMSRRVSISSGARPGPVEGPQSAGLPARVLRERCHPGRDGGDSRRTCVVAPKLEEVEPLVRRAEAPLLESGRVTLGELLRVLDAVRARDKAGRREGLRRRRITAGPRADAHGEKDRATEDALEQKGTEWEACGSPEERYGHRAVALRFPHAIAENAHKLAAVDRRLHLECRIDGTGLEVDQTHRELGVQPLEERVDARRVLREHEDVQHDASSLREQAQHVVASDVGAEQEPAAALAYEVEEMLGRLVVDLDALCVSAPDDHAVEDVLRELVEVPEDVAPSGCLAEGRGPSGHGPQRAQVVHGRAPGGASRHEEVDNDRGQQRDRGPAPEISIEPADQKERAHRPALRHAGPRAAAAQPRVRLAARLRRSAGARASMPRVSRV